MFDLLTSISFIVMAGSFILSRYAVQSLEKEVRNQNRRERARELGKQLAAQSHHFDSEEAQLAVSVLGSCLLCHGELRMEDVVDTFMEKNTAKLRGVIRPPQQRRPN
jgi:hypothetical protein